MSNEGTVHSQTKVETYPLLCCILN